MFHDGNDDEVVKKDRTWGDIRDTSEAERLRNANQGKVNPDARGRMFCVGTLALQSLMSYDSATRGVGIERVGIEQLLSKSS